MDFNDDLDMLPENLQSLVADMREEKLRKINDVGQEVAAKRDEAVSYRKSSGIETIWAEDEEYYEGIDDANRSEQTWLKSPSEYGGIRKESPATAGCTAFFNVTRQFVDSASARMGDILLPAGDWNFTIKPSPVQDEGDVPKTMPVDDGLPQLDVAPMPQPQGGQGMQPVPVAKNESPKAIADKMAEKTEQKIRDWLVECSYHTEVRKVLEDAAKLGSGVLKGPVPQKRTARRITETEETTTIEIVETVEPESSYVDIWDFFPDPACGEDIHNGNYVLERDRLSAKQLKDLKGLPGYLSDQIDQVIDEGPGKCHYSDGMRDPDGITNDDDRFDVWYFYGAISADSLCAMGVDAEVEGDTDSKDQVPAIVTLVNDTPIRASINPLDTGCFPYDVMVWQRRANSPWGIGVARQGRTAQEMINASARVLMDNAALSSGPMVVVRQGAIRPADGTWDLRARKIWIATEQADMRTVADAILPINIPMVQVELTNIIQLGYKMMEDSTGIVFLLQGQQGSAPDTVGGMELLHRNASAMLRRLARIYDERVTEPHIRRYYDWLMLHGPDDCKGDFRIEAIGSTALVEREVQSIEAMQILQMSLNPMYGIDPEKAMTEMLKARRMVPDKFMMDEEKKQMLSQQQPSIPAVEVAKIRAEADSQLAQMRLQAEAQTNQMKLQSDMQIAQMREQAAYQKMKVDTDRDTVYQQTMMSRDQVTAEIRVEELKLKRELAMLDYANKHNMKIEEIKAKLATETMRLRTQKELAAMNKKTPQVATPAIEPPGRARDGHAFEE